MSLEPLRQIWMPKRTPRRRRASVSGASPERAPEPEAEPESEFGTPTASADVGAELAEVRANQAATATALETLLTQVATLTSAVAAAVPSGSSGAPELPSSPPPSAPAPAPEPGSLSGHAGAAVLRALLVPSSSSSATPESVNPYTLPVELGNYNGTYLGMHPPRSATTPQIAQCTCLYTRGLHFDRVAHSCYQL